MKSLSSMFEKYRRDHLPFRAWSDDYLKTVSDERLRESLVVAASVFCSMKDEAVRRGIWDAMKSGDY